VGVRVVPLIQTPIMGLNLIKLNYTALTTQWGTQSLELNGGRVQEKLELFKESI